MNPWVSIWTRPRETISAIVKENPNRGIWLLAWIYGFLSSVNAIQAAALGTRLHFIAILTLATVLAPFWGMVVFSFWSWLVKLTGKLFKGKGTFRAVRAAYAWSCVPLTINLVLWFLLLSYFGKTLFSASQPSSGSIALLIGALAAKVIAMVWSLVIYINALAEIHRFSIARAVLSILLAWFAVALLIFLILAGIGLWSDSSMTPHQAALHVVPIIERSVVLGPL